MAWHGTEKSMLAEGRTRFLYCKAGGVLQRLLRFLFCEGGFAFLPQKKLPDQLNLADGFN